MTRLAEIRWGKEAGLAAILIPGVRPGHPLEGLWSSRYDPIWALAQDLDMPVNQHSGAGAPDVGTDPGEVASANFESVGSHFYSQRTIWNFIYGGVFERFPRLKFVMTEDGLGWADPLMTLLDNHFRRLSDLAPYSSGCSVPPRSDLRCSRPIMSRRTCTSRPRVMFVDPTSKLGTCSLENRSCGARTIHTTRGHFPSVPWPFRRYLLRRTR